MERFMKEMRRELLFTSDEEYELKRQIVLSQTDEGEVLAMVWEDAENATT